MLRISGLKLSINEDKSQLRLQIIKKLKLREIDLVEYKIYKESIDARKKDMIYFVYTVDVKLATAALREKCLKQKDVSLTPELDYEYVLQGDKPLTDPPIIIGSGPAGLFAGLLLAQMGYKPIVLERGKDVDSRAEAVQKFWQGGSLNPECNVQFGEGGAGTFSDGKLTTLIKDKRCRKVLEELVEAGAPEDIIYSHKPHVGTDILRDVVKNIRQKIISLGGEVLFNSKVTKIIQDNSQVLGVEVNHVIRYVSSVVIVSIGHSARDTFAMLYDAGLEIVQKPFSMGVRIEHPQTLINEVQYGQFAQHSRLGAADYKLVHHCSNGRSVYTFCMCPGGVVVAATSEEGRVVTNGMSEYARAAENANSAVLVGVGPEDFKSQHPLAGMEFQREWEEKAFQLGGRNYHAPAQRVGDFLQDKASEHIGTVKPSYLPGVTLTDLRECLPDFVAQALKEGLVGLDNKLKGFAHSDALMTGVETRSSSPIRIIRDEEMEANIKGVYPAGEGPGYAGGIISAAVDGIRVAEAIVRKYRPVE